MTVPSLGRAAAAGARAAFRTGWLAPVSALLSALRAAAAVPALAVAVLLPLHGAVASARAHPLAVTAALEGALAVMASARYRALVAGLALAAGLLSGLLRVLFLSGALPTLGASLAGVDPGRRFAPGVTWGLPRQLATALLAEGAHVAALGYTVAVAIAALRLGLTGSLQRAPLPLAFLGATALTSGTAGLLVARVLGDAAASRAAILGEAPATAWASACRRLLARPGAFLLGGLAALVASAMASASLQPAAALLGAAASRLPGWVALGPQAFVALLGLLVAAVVDLAWLGTVAVLACGAAPDARRRVSA